MKLIALIFAFAGYADISQAQNTVVRDTDGSPWVLQQDSVRTVGTSVSGVYYVDALHDIVRVYVTGCAQGRGHMLAKQGNAHKFYDWAYSRNGVTDQLAIAVCAEAR